MSHEGQVVAHGIGEGEGHGGHHVVGEPEAAVVTEGVVLAEQTRGCPDLSSLVLSVGALQRRRGVHGRRPGADLGHRQQRQYRYIFQKKQGLDGFDIPDGQLVIRRGRIIPRFVVLDLEIPVMRRVIDVTQAGIVQQGLGQATFRVPLGHVGQIEAVALRKGLYLAQLGGDEVVFRRLRGVGGLHGPLEIGEGDVALTWQIPGRLQVLLCRQAQGDVPPEPVGDEAVKVHGGAHVEPGALELVALTELGIERTESVG